MSTLPGAAHARTAAAFVRELVDSPMETRLRMLIVVAGLPEPVVNMTVEDGAGRRRYDLCWPECRLVVEYDGRQHAESIEQWTSPLLPPLLIVAGNDLGDPAGAYLILNVPRNDQRAGAALSGMEQPAITPAARR